MTSESIRPYGDTLDDGMVQLSFTLPVENGARARRAAEVYAAKLNCDSISVVHSEKLGENFTFFIVYARAIPSLNYAEITVSEAHYTELDFAEINETIRTRLGRRIVVVGATIGSDAHTVGIDAIMNMKGYNHDYGLERYPEIEACNMGSQVTAEDLIAKGLEMNADAILVSQTVTQKDSHIRNFTELIELLEAEEIRNRFILIAGGPRITNEFAIELGYDAGFGRGCLPSMVASYILSRLVQE